MTTIAEDINAHCGHFVVYESSGASPVTWILKTNNALDKAFSALLVIALFFLNF